jgi:hypothetical protein
MKTLWLLPARLGELARLRQAGPRMARRSAIWQSQRAEVSREKAHADQLALIAGGSVMLARTSCDVTSPARELLADRLREVGAVLERLAEAQGIAPRGSRPSMTRSPPRVHLASATHPIRTSRPPLASSASLPGTS